MTVPDAAPLERAFVAIVERDAEDAMLLELADRLNEARNKAIGISPTRIVVVRRAGPRGSDRRTRSRFGGVAR